MSFSRRAFVKTLGVGGAIVATRGYEPLGRLFGEVPLSAQARPLLLHNNENPLGPGERALNAVRAAIGGGGPAGRYPFGTTRGLVDAIAQRYSVKPENVMLGNGSTQLLRSATQVFTSKDRPLVGGSPTYEECTGYAELIGTPVRAVPLNSELQLDLDGMAQASKGAGMVFINNPNNPTATVIPADQIEAFVDRVLTASPHTYILIDEAYHDYVTDPSHRTQIPLAIKNKQVVVCRTFSKAHGMAGMRTGYAIGHAETLKKMSGWQYGSSLNLAGIIAGIESIKDMPRLEQEKARNTAARKHTLDWFRKVGFEATDSQCNFIFVNIRRPAREFRDGCRQQGVLVGRDFPPYEKTHTRISIGTMDEMRRATEAFGKVLGVATPTAAAA